MKDNCLELLHDYDSNLQSSREVDLIVNYLRDNGEVVPQNPYGRLGAYLLFLVDEKTANYGIITGDEDSISTLIESRIISSDNIPDSYFKLQQKIALEEGRGHIEITESMKHHFAEIIQNDQRESLNSWARYLARNDAIFPDWFRFVVWESITKLGKLDYEKKSYQKRSKSTVAPFPELNSESLAIVYSNLLNSLEDYDEQTKRSIRETSFASLYAEALIETYKSDREVYKTVEGSWKVYCDNAEDLSNSLIGYNTGWCTAGIETARSQLDRGDFYVYYSKNKNGEDVVPRIAIRMVNEFIAEVRGIGENQAMEPELSEILTIKLKELGDNGKYLKKTEDMQRVTRIAATLEKDPTAILAIEDLRFLYEIDGEIIGFDQDEIKDPRLYDLLKDRDAISDLEKILGTNEVAVLIDIIFKLDRTNIIATNPVRLGFEKLSIDKKSIVIRENPELLLKNIHNLKDTSIEDIVSGIDSCILEPISLGKLLCDFTPDETLDGKNVDFLFQYLDIESFLKILPKIKPGSVNKEITSYLCEGYEEYRGMIAQSLFTYLDRFQDYFYGDIVQELIRNTPNGLELVLKNSDKFIIGRGLCIELYEHLKTSEKVELFDKHLLERIVTTKLEIAIMQNNYKEVLDLMDQKEGQSLVLRFLKMYDIEITLKRNKRFAIVLSRNLDKFSELSTEIAEILINNRRVSAVKNNIDSFINPSEVIKLLKDRGVALD
jgi:hypothetical protein